LAPSDCDPLSAFAVAFFGEACFGESARFFSV
jgi:hypothetical protein